MIMIIGTNVILQDRKSNFYYFKKYEICRSILFYCLFDVLFNDIKQITE